MEVEYSVCYKCGEEIYKSPAEGRTWHHQDIKLENHRAVPESHLINEKQEVRI
jgi:hypothetical protein